MGIVRFGIDRLTGLEPGIPGGETPPLYGRRDARRYGGPEARSNRRFPPLPVFARGPVREAV
jgi:hypothetical protein